MCCVRLDGRMDSLRSQKRWGGVSFCLRVAFGHSCLAALRWVLCQVVNVLFLVWSDLTLPAYPICASVPTELQQNAGCAVCVMCVMRARARVCVCVCV